MADYLFEDFVPENKKRPRKHDPLWDAIVEITGCDASTAATFIGKVVRELKNAEQPYTEKDVIKLGELYATKGWGSPTLSSILKNIGWVRTGKHPHEYNSSRVRNTSSTKIPVIRISPNSDAKAIDSSGSTDQPFG